MDHPISATRAAREFSALLNRVHCRGESFCIERGGEPVGRLAPAAPPRCTLADLAAVMRDRPRPDPGYWKTVSTLVRRQPKLPPSPWRR